MRSRSAAIAFVILLAVGAGWAGWNWRQHQARVSALPVVPDLSRQLPALGERMLAAQGKFLQEGDVSALGEVTRLYHANGFMEEAEHGYRALLRLDPRQPRWPHLLAVLLTEYGRMDEALPLLQQTVVLAPDYAPARLRLADALAKSNRTEEAATMYHELLRKEPRSPYALLGLARLDLGARRLAEARARLDEAIAIDADFSGAQSLLATVAGLQGEAAVAEAARARATTAGRYREAPDPWAAEQVDFCYNPYRLQVMASSSSGSRHWREALPPLERALSLAPDNLSTRRQLGRALFSLGDLMRAREQFEAAVKLAPDEPLCYADLIPVYRALNDLPGALRNLTAGLAHCPNDAGLHYNYALALLSAGQMPEAASELEISRQLAPDKPVAARDLIPLYFQLRRERDAARLLDESLERFPDLPAFQLMAARYRIMKRDAARAAGHWGRARQAGANANELAAIAAEYRRTFGQSPSDAVE